MSAPVVTVSTPGRRPIVVVLDAPLEVGRECDGIMLADPLVSRRHALLEPRGQSVYVTDLDSSNGTTVDDEPVRETTAVSPGSRIQVGHTSIDVGEPTSDPASPRARPPGATTEVRTTSIELVADAVRADLDPELIGVSDEPGTLTVVFSDIEASTERAVALGDEQWMGVLGAHNRLINTHVVAHRGRVVKNQGDGFMLCFRSARQALLACVGVQRDLERRRRAAAGDAIRVRIGVHTGEVLVDDDGDLFGRHVVVAARIGGLAEGGQILVSDLVRQIAEPRGDIPFGTGQEVELRGIGASTVVHEVRWSDYPA